MSLLLATISDPTGLPDVVPVGPRHRLLRKTRSSFAALRMTINGSRASSRTVAEGLPAHLSSVDPPYTLLASLLPFFGFAEARLLRRACAFVCSQPLQLRAARSALSRIRERMRKECAAHQRDVAG